MIYRAHLAAVGWESGPEDKHKAIMSQRNIQLNQPRNNHILREQLIDSESWRRNCSELQMIHQLNFRQKEWLKILTTGLEFPTRKTTSSTEGNGYATDGEYDESLHNANDLLLLDDFASIRLKATTRMVVSSHGVFPHFWVGEGAREILLVKELTSSAEIWRFFFPCRRSGFTFGPSIEDTL